MFLVPKEPVNIQNSLKTLKLQVIVGKLKIQARPLCKFGQLASKIPKSEFIILRS